MRAQFLALLLTCGLPLIAAAQDKLTNGNADNGKLLLEKACDSCHKALFAGDANKVYLRETRRVDNTENLLAQVRLWNSSANAKWTDQEVIDATAYLNANFYKFK